MMTLTGSFLVAQPMLQDLNFREAVVLLLAHGEAGAYGIIVNRPVPVPNLAVPLFQGGPCHSPGVVMLHGHPEWLDKPAAGQEASEENREVAPGIYVGDAACLVRASKPAPGQAYRFRLFRGYAGWGPGQLEDEIAAEAWSIVPAIASMLFDVPAEQLWAKLRPPTIPEPSLN